MGIIRRILIAMLLLSIVPSYANSLIKTDFLSPYTVTYSALYKKGITLRVEGSQTLTRKDDKLWQFDFEVDTLLASLNETSTFELQEQNLRPIEYRYSSSILGKKKNVTVTFDWNKMTALNNVKGSQWKMSINDITLDRLTLQLQLRYDLLNNRDDLSYDIADGGKLKRYIFKKQTTELIDTKLGELETIKVVRTDNLSDKRHQYFWFAPEQGFLLVKMEHFEKGESYTLNIDSVTTLKQTQKTDSTIHQVD